MAAQCLKPTGEVLTRRLAAIERGFKLAETLPRTPAAKLLETAL